jgi:hypothetical protein
MFNKLPGGDQIGRQKLMAAGYPGDSLVLALFG